MKDNKMRKIEIEKVVLSTGGVADELEKSARLLEVITGKKAVKTLSKKRIPSFGIRPGLEIGCKVTLRGKKAEEILVRLLKTIDNKIAEKQINDEDFSFGIEEYIEIPGLEYQRDLGIRGLNVTVVFKRKGKRVKLKKIKKGRIPNRQRVTKKEIIKLLESKFNTQIGEGK